MKGVFQTNFRPDPHFTTGRAGSKRAHLPEAAIPNSKKTGKKRRPKKAIRGGVGPPIVFSGVFSFL
jgi:hypothetical protein